MSGDVEGYMARLGRAMYWADAGLKLRIMEEMRAHIADARADGERVWKPSEAPEVLAARYLQIYGFGRVFAGLCAVLAALAALCSALILPLPSMEIVQLLAFSCALLIAAWCGIAGGRRSGAIVGAAGACARVTGMTMNIAVLGWTIEPLFIALFLVSCAFLPFVGWGGGEARKRWQGE
ncbi:MAG: hypothetical protein AB1665_07985 [Candidatus Thermoplasmatota archaeon]